MVFLLVQVLKESTWHGRLGGEWKYVGDSQWEGMMVNDSGWWWMRGDDGKWQWMIINLVKVDADGE